MNTPSFKPKCTWCGQPLEGCGFPLPRKGVGRCPVGNCDVPFEVEVDETNLVKDKNGKLTPTIGWKVTSPKH